VAREADAVDTHSRAKDGVAGTMWFVRTTYSTSGF